MYRLASLVCGLLTPVVWTFKLRIVNGHVGTVRSSPYLPMHSPRSLDAENFLLAMLGATTDPSARETGTVNGGRIITWLAIQQSSETGREQVHWLSRVGGKSNMERSSTAAISQVRTGEELATRRLFRKVKVRATK